MASSYEDYKYMLQDLSKLYFGAKYTFRELMEHPECNFKFKSIMEHYLFKELDPDTSLESAFYYMEKDSFVFRTFQQLKVKVKINILSEKKKLFGKTERVYVEKTVTLEELADMSLAVKKRDGVSIQEIIFNKLALMSFVL